MAWSLTDTADSIEAEEQLKSLPNDRDTDDDFFELVLRVTRSERAAQRSLYLRVLNRKWALTDGV